jgi:aldehyde reductase
MESLVDKGLVRSIGVSNFNVQSLWDMLSYARIPPVCNEVELHPLCVQPKLIKFMLENKIEPIAYCPIAKGSAADPPKSSN